MKGKTSAWVYTKKNLDVAHLFPNLNCPKSADSWTVPLTCGKYLTK